MIDGRKTRDGSAVKTFTCESCGEEFQAYQSRRKGPRYFCTRQCRIDNAKAKFTCKRCGTEFEVHKCDLKGTHIGDYCSRGCYLTARREAGVQERVCENCKTKFKEFTSRVLEGKGRYCSLACQREANPARGGSIERQCETCEMPFWTSPAVLARGEGRFCGRPCAMLGENNPQWTGGHTVEYPPEWNRALRRQIKNRDKRQCVICGEQNGLDVHHIDYDKQNCDPSNLVTLCHPHHSSTNFNRGQWLAYFTEQAGE